MRAGLTLLALAALCAAAAGRELSERAGRDLLQVSGNDCSRNVANCATCRYAFYAGTTTRTICTQCAEGYRVAANGRACWCAAGWYKTGDTCTACTSGYYCPGARSTAESASRTQCPDNTQTLSIKAMSARECLTTAGYGWNGTASNQCAKGTYNPGKNLRACTKCPGGLTTAGAGTGSIKPQDCVAPAGSYYLAGKAVRCAQGTYKSTEANADCAKCPTGFTTAAGAVGKTAVAECDQVLPGYTAAASQGATVTTGFFASACGANTYRTTLATYNNGAGVLCAACPTNMQTLPNTVGATSSDACLAPPGYGWNVTSGDAYICPLGTYNAGWNREPCTSCGTGTVTTDATGSTSADDCVIPAGNGAVRSGNTVAAYVCPADTYGRASATYGITDVSCEKCMDHTSTRGATTSTSVAACVTDAGYGYDDGAVNQCDYGYYAAGGDVAACTFCGEGKNTSVSAGDMTPTKGATAIAQCQIAAGWESDGGSGIRPCPAGKYKSALGSASCSACGAGYTTTVQFAAIAADQCDACTAGYGGASCAQCGSGYWSGGGNGKGACNACDAPTGYNGQMVSRAGSVSGESCVPEFASDGGVATQMPFDIIPMTLSNLTADNANTETACQTACDNSANCQYFVFYTYTGALASSASTQCFLRVAADVTPITIAAGSTINTVLFEAKSGLYAAYKLIATEDVTTIGSALTLSGTAASAPSYTNVRAWCDATPACIGLAVGSDANTWRAFGGSKWEGAVGKVRFIGANLA